MSKVFRRPMFRKGGQVNEGIMTGIVDRENHAENPFVGGQRGMGVNTDFGLEEKVNTTPQMNLPDLKTMTKENIDLLLEAAGDRGGYDPLTQFLLQYGPAAAKQTGGGTFANLIAAAEKPVASLIASKQKEDDFLRSIRTQATGAAMKRRSELEQADIDNRFREKLADKQISANQEIAMKQIAATMQEARLDHERALQRQAEKSKLDYENRSRLLEEGRDLERLSPIEKVERDLEKGKYTQEYEDTTKEKRRSSYEHIYRNEIATKFGESKVGGHINVDVSNQDKVNSIMRKKIKAGGAEKIYYNVNDGKTYVLIQEGKQAVLKPINLTGEKEQITEFTEIIPGGTETIKETKDFSYFNEAQKKKIKELQEETKELPFGGSGA